MIDLNEFEKAENKINDIIKLRDDLIKASPNLNDVKSHLDWHKKVLDEIPEEQHNILSILESTIQSTLNIVTPTFDTNILTGLTGSYFSASGDTLTIIKSYGSKHYNLVNEYSDLNNTEDLINRIQDILVIIKDEYQEVSLCELLNDARETYLKWKVGAVNNSVLATDIRDFQDVFHGMLHLARVNNLKPKPPKNPDTSWPKMAEVLARSGSGMLKSLKNEHQRHIDRHADFTVILKKTKRVSRIKMESCFKDYIEHVFTVLTLIDEKYLS